MTDKDEDMVKITEAIAQEIKDGNKVEALADTTTLQKELSSDVRRVERF